jgi:hypothetical protein
VTASTDLAGAAAVTAVALVREPQPEVMDAVAALALWAAQPEAEALAARAVAPLALQAAAISGVHWAAIAGVHTAELFEAVTAVEAAALVTFVLLSQANANVAHVPSRRTVSAARTSRECFITHLQGWERYPGRARN